VTEEVGEVIKLALPKGPNGVGVAFRSLKTETCPVFETSYLVVFRISNDGQMPQMQ
jgi:hypothetical protein